MRKLVYSLFAVTIFLFINPLNTIVSATSWIEMDPQEVSDRAEVVVSGTYDFSSKPIGSDFIFQGYSFIVEKVYKGEASKQIIAGIDHYDVGWVEELQSEGGEFLLFLEKSDSAKFLTPVGGPNGMIKVLNGIVKYGNEDRSAFYNDFLKRNHKEPSSEINATFVDKQNSSKFTPFYLGVIALAAIGVIILLYCFIKKRKR